MKFETGTHQGKNKNKERYSNLLDVHFTTLIGAKEHTRDQREINYLDKNQQHATKYSTKSCLL